MSSKADIDSTVVERRYNRRTFLRVTAAGAGVASVGVGTDRVGLSPVGDAEAIAPAVFAVGVGASLAVGWALGEWDPLESESPPDGMTGEALKSTVYKASRARESENRSTIVDNGNILDGIRHNAYVDGKLSAIEEINAGSSESDVLNAATSAVDEYGTTIKTNFLKSWNESLLELESNVSALSSHADTSVADIYNFWNQSSGSEYNGAPIVETDGAAYTMDDDTEFSIHCVRNDNYTGGAGWTPVSEINPYDTFNLEYSYDGNSSIYLEGGDWVSMFTEMETVFDDVRTGLSTWVNSVYGQVQSGEIEVSELLTPRERAAMMSDDEEYPQAVADLIALNVPVDVEREATVSIPSKNATLVGTFGVTDDSTPMETGTTYSPSEFGSVYFTYDMSKGTGDWSEYQSGVDGGVVTFTSEPYAKSVFNISTTAGETVTVKTGDFTDNGDGTWSVDVSTDLETPITEVDSVTFEADVNGTEYTTVQITDDFVVESFVDSDGNEHSSANFESSEPQDDSNYITQEEWENMDAKMEELIAKYEESQNGSSGGLFGSTDIPGGALVAGAAALGAILLGQSQKE